MLVSIGHANDANPFENLLQITTGLRYYVRNQFELKKKYFKIYTSSKRTN